MTKKQHYMTWEERQKLEALYNHAKMPVSKIAKELGFARQTIYNELKLGFYLHTYDFYDKEQYSAYKAQQIHDIAQSGKGPAEKIGNHMEYAEYLAGKIKNDRFSPAAALAAAAADPDHHFDITICTRTLYRYIKTGMFQDLTEKDLLYQGCRSRKGADSTAHRVAHPKLPSISDRPEDATDRDNPGHWEGDLIVGKSGTSPVVLTLVERRSRILYAEKLPNRQAATIRAAFDRFELQAEACAPRIRTITFDNGSEFLEHDKLVKSAVSDCQRFEVYYCHSYCAWEKGSNENANRMLRRWFPKGTDFSAVSDEQLAEAVAWINAYPRKILGWKSAAQVYNEGLALSA